MSRLRPDGAGRGVARGFVLVLCVVLVVAGYRAARNGIADVYAAPALSYLLYRDADIALTDFALENLIDAIGRGVALAPGNPEYLASLGYLRQLELTRDDGGLGEDELARRSAEAQAHYARAASIRPTWPYDWGDVAIEEYRLGRYSSTAYHDALVRVARFGPWKDDEQRLIVELGSGPFESLSPAAEQAYLTNLDRALRRQPQIVGAIVDDYALWDRVCGRAGLVPGGEIRIAGGDRLTSLAAHCRQVLRSH